MFYDNDEWDDYDREPDVYAKGSAYCSDCGRKFRTEELIVMKDHRYCRECFEDRFPGVDPEYPDSYEECACCEEYFHKDEMEKAGGGWVCRSCLTKCFSMCDSCCEYYLKENMTELGDARLCDKCLSEQFGRCDVCREYCEKDKLVTGMGIWLDGIIEVRAFTDRAFLKISSMDLCKEFQLPGGFMALGKRLSYSETGLLSEDD